MMYLFSLVGLLGGAIIMVLMYREFRAEEKEKLASKLFPSTETKEEFVEDEELEYCQQTTYRLEDDELECSMS